jgi:hypothetical protein
MRDRSVCFWISACLGIHPTLVTLTTLVTLAAS